MNTKTIEVTASMAQTLLGAVITASIEENDNGYHFRALDMIQEARKLLPALGEYEASYTESLNTLYEIYKEKADAKKAQAATRMLFIK